jgi:Carboxypeptidase regulatory-like domain/TonB dependent receptor
MPVKNRWISGISVLMCLIAGALPTASQAVFGNISGSVFDSTEALVPGASIMITDADRGTVYQITSDEAGNYSQTHLLAGRYQVEVSSAGFAKFVANATVQVDATTRVDVVLKVEATQEMVTVVDKSPLLAVDRPEIKTTFTGVEVDRLPVLDRNLTTLMLAVPGTQMNSWQHASSENPQGGVQANVNGQFFTANGFLLDGTENQSAILGIAVINPNLDSLHDFTVVTSNYDAEFGSVSGALLQATTKSGTNSLHGSFFEFLRNDAFNATDTFTKLNSPTKWNQFGGSIGGPIKHDKLFGFFDYQGTRRHDGGSLITTVPTAAERSGDLSSLLGSYICAGSGPAVSPTPCGNPLMVTTTEGLSVPARAGMVFDPSSGDPQTSLGRRVFSKNGQVNMIPVPAAMQSFMKMLPLPNSGSDIFNNYIASVTGQIHDDQYDGRIDYNITPVSHLFGRYTLADFDKTSPGAFGDLAGGPSPLGFAGRATARNQSLAAGFDHTFSPSLITDFRFGFYRYRVNVDPNGLGLTPATDAGLPGLNTGAAETSGTPAFYINGDGGFNFGYGLNVNQCNCPLRETENHFQWVNNWTTQFGRHMLKWGVDLRRAQQSRVPSDSHRSGEISFNDSSTGSPEVDAVASGLAGTGSGVASFLLGQPSSFARYITGQGFEPGLRESRLFLFAQDSWRVTPRLTLNYGLRWEDYLPQAAAHPGGAGSFDPTTGEVLAAGIGTVPSNMGVRAYNLGFAPRLGIAYQFGSKTVVRAGYGRSFNPSGLGSVFGQGADYNPPVLNAQSLGQSNPYVGVFSLLQGPPAPAQPPVGANGRYPLPDGVPIFYYTYPANSYRIPLVDSWNLAVQREISNDFAVEVAYIGNVGRHLFLALNENQAVPGPGDFNSRRPFFGRFGLEQPIYQTCNCDNSSYNAMQVKLQKRAAHGLDFLLTYTWSKAMGNSEGAGAFSDNYNVRDSHGPMSWDRTHTITFTQNWELPFGRGRRWSLKNNSVADMVLGGWRLSAIGMIASGLPFTPTVSSAPLLNADFNYVRADVVGNPAVSKPGAAEWFNPAAFTAPQEPYRDGTASRNSLRGPSLNNWNLALGKNLLKMEEKQLEFRWEVFNAFNHVNLGLPLSVVDVSGAGQITSTQVPMRKMQLGLRFSF